MNRIAVFLDEEEVTDQVSSLKKDNTLPYLPGADHEGLGLKNATLRWNAVPETRMRPSPRPQTSKLQSTPISVSRTEDLTETSISSGEDRNFELIAWPSASLMSKLMNNTMLNNLTKRPSYPTS